MNTPKNPLDTLRESDHSPETTVREGTPPQSAVLLGQLIRFREYVVTKPLPTKGAEADLYLVQRDEREFILKLYRNAMAPKQEVLGKIWALSRDNPHQLVSILDVGFDESSGRWYEIMEYVPLGSLRDAEFRWGDRRAFVLVLVKELTAALHLLHQNGIVHCDLKPSNILIRSFDPPDLILTDFGIASQMASDVSLKMTTHKGTPMYWAPEAFSGLVAPASDWWGLGVIALEYLLGAHPFEGFGQQQITYQLTVKNIEIPPGTGEMEPLLKGLLTKDVAKRWGYEQITRWLAGERNIPVHYQNMLSVEESPLNQGGERVPFRFEGEELLALEEVARAFAASEERWQLGAGEYLRYVRQWLETNGEFDKAVKLGELLTGNANSDLFHFVHSNASLPFIYMGMTIDSHTLLSCVKKQGDATATPAERTIAKGLDGETLLDLLDAHCRYNGRANAPLRHLILLLRSAGSVGRYDYAEVLLNPAAYQWPNLPEGEAPADPIAALKEAGGIPMRHEAYAELRQRYALPEELVRQLQNSESHASALEEIQEMESKSLLLDKASAIQINAPLNSDGDCTLDLESYKNFAKRKNWGGDGALQSAIARACVQLDAIAKKMGKESDMRWIIGQLQDIRNHKVTQRSRDFVAQVTTVIEKNAPDGADAFSPSYLDYTLFGVPALMALLFMFFPISQQMIIPAFLGMSVVAIAATMLILFFMGGAKNRRFQSLFLRVGISAILGIIIIGMQGSSSSPLSRYLRGLRHPGGQQGLLPAITAIFQKYNYVLYLFRYGTGSMFLLWLGLRWRRYTRNKIREKYTEMIRQLNGLR